MAISVLDGRKAVHVTLTRYATVDMNSQVLHVVHEKDPWIVEEDVEKQWFDNSPPVADKKSRRKSWHAIKFERKRKKGVVEAVPTLPEVRQKRPSWWNIFAGQQWPRYVGNIESILNDVLEMGEGVTNTVIIVLIFFFVFVILNYN